MSKSTVTYHQVVITPCASGFGEYEVSELGDAWDDASDLLADTCDEYIELDEGNLARLTPEQIAEVDIRGRIHNEPPRVFAQYEHNELVGWWGIVEREVAAD